MWVPILILLFNCVNLSKLLNFVPRFPLRQNGDNNSTYLIGLVWVLNELLYGKVLECVWHTVGILFATTLTAGVTELLKYWTLILIIKLFINCYEKFYSSISSNHTHIQWLQIYFVKTKPY